MIRFKSRMNSPSRGLSAASNVSTARSQVASRIVSIARCWWNVSSLTGPSSGIATSTAHAANRNASPGFDRPRAVGVAARQIIGISPIRVAAASFRQTTADHVADRDDRDIRPRPHRRKRVPAIAVPVTLANDFRRNEDADDDRHHRPKLRPARAAAPHAVRRCAGGRLSRWRAPRERCAPRRGRRLCRAQATLALRYTERRRVAARARTHRPLCDNALDDEATTARTCSSRCVSTPTT
jgi:hypothetical protein